MAKDKDTVRPKGEARAQEKYSVLVSFTDPEDKNAPEGANVYWAGKNTYPRDGYEPTAERIAYLQSNKTALGKAVISSTNRK